MPPHAIAAHADADLGIDPDSLSTWHAAGASAVSFALGAALPILAILVLPVAARVPVMCLVVLLGLGLTGAPAAAIGGAWRTPAVLPMVIGSTVGIAFTYAVGRVLDATGL